MTTVFSKSARQQRIIDIISRNHVRTQDELRSALQADGYQVTQATLSRDLDELGATKIVAVNGESVYAIPVDGDPLRTLSVTPDSDSTQRLARVVEEVMTACEAAMNLVVVHTRPGAANYLAGALDKNSHAGIVGSVAGDDTVMIACRTIDAAEEVAALLLELSHNRQRDKKNG